MRFRRAQPPLPRSWACACSSEGIACRLGLQLEFCYQEGVPGRGVKASVRVGAVEAWTYGPFMRGLIYVTSLVLLGSVFPPIATCQPSPSAPELRRANQLERMGRLLEAIAAYRAVLAKYPASEPAVLGLSSVYRKVFNYEEARRALQQYLKAYPGAVAARIALAEADIQLDQYDAARQQLERALAKDRGSARAHLDLGICYQSKSQNDQALQEFNAAVALDPRSAAAWYYRASLYADRNDLAPAEQDGRKSLALDPGNAATRVLLAKVWLRSGKCTAAAEVLRPITGPDSTNTDALFQLARAYECLKQSESARATRQHFERLSNHAQATHTAQEEAKHLSEQAEQSARQNRLAPAMDLLQQALAKDPESGPAHALLAKIYFSQSDLPKARGEVETALRSNPYHPDYLYVLGRVLEKQGDAQQALQVFQRVVLVNPRESDAYYEIAQIHLRAGERQQALTAMREAVRLSPDDADYRRALEGIENRSKTH